MKILQVIPYFAPAWNYGGPVQVAYRLSENLVKRGHEVTVYATDALDTASRIDTLEETINGIKVKRFRNLSNYLAFSHKIFLTPGMYRTVKREICDFDIIHLHEYRTVQNVIVHHYTRKYGIPYVLQPHGSTPRIAAKQRLKQVYDTLWGHNMLKSASRVIALTGTETEQYKTIGVSEDRIVVVPNGIDLSEFEDLPQKGEFRSRYGLNNGEKIILYLGRIHEIKGLELLVRTFTGLVKEFDSSRLVIVGPDDGYLASLKKLITQLKIEEQVLFTGPIYGREKLKAYVDADIYVLPSVYETFPVGILEACACGTPVITTQAGDKIDLHNNRAGLVVEYNEAQLKDAISEILHNDELAKQFGENAKQLVRERFNWQTITEKVELLYSSIAGS